MRPQSGSASRESRGDVWKRRGNELPPPWLDERVRNAESATLHDRRRRRCEGAHGRRSATARSSSPRRLPDRSPEARLARRWFLLDGSRRCGSNAILDGLMKDTTWGFARTRWFTFDHRRASIARPGACTSHGTRSALVPVSNRRLTSREPLTPAREAHTQREGTRPFRGWPGLFLECLRAAGRLSFVGLDGRNGSPVDHILGTGDR